MENKTILVVEDEAIIRMSAVATLEDAGFQVLEAGNSAQALDMLSRHDEVSILLTDVRMPGSMDGLALVAQVHHDHPGIRSIVMSAHATALQASEAGAVGFLSKPYMEQTMIQVVYDTLKRHLGNRPATSLPPGRRASLGTKGGDARLLCAASSIFRSHTSIR